MVSSLHLRFTNHLRKYAVFTLACVWISGLFLGVLVAGSASLDFSPMIAFFQDQSLSGALLVMLFPLIVSILLIYMGQLWLIPVIAFFKSFCFGYVSWLLMRDYGSASWLIHLLVMFSDCVSLPLLWCFWCGFLKSTHGSLFFVSVPMVIIAVSIAVLDHYFISPILSLLQIS